MGGHEQTPARALRITEFGELDGKRRKW